MRVSFRVMVLVNGRAWVSVRVWFRFRVRAGPKARASVSVHLG